MPLTKQPLNINFSQGLDTKTDPFQVPAGKFLSLQNSIFDKAGMLAKRNGYGLLRSLPDSSSRYLTTFNGDLTAIGNNFYTESSSTNSWLNKGTFIPVDLNTIPIIRNNSYQNQADSVVAPNGLMCTVYTEFTALTGSAVAHYRYIISNSITGQVVVGPVTLTDADTTYGTPRVFVLSNFFIILFTTHPASYHLQYIAVNINNPDIATSAIDIETSYVPSTKVNFDGVVVGSKLFIAYNTTSGGQAVKVTYLTSNLTLVTALTFATSIATLFSLCADTTNLSDPAIYISFYDSNGNTGYTAIVDQNLNQILAPTQIKSTGGTILNMTSVAHNGIATIFYELSENYTGLTDVPFYSIFSLTITQSGTVNNSSSFSTTCTVGLASKAFLYNGTPYYLAIYGSELQPTYFLIDASSTEDGNFTSDHVVARLAYGNSGSYYTTGLPNATLIGDQVHIPYLVKDSLQAVNKSQGVPSAAGIYSQLGVNLVKFNFKPNFILGSEIGSNLNLTGGFVTGYDGSNLCEQGFFLYPENIQTTIDTSGGNIGVQQYYYIVVYEWTDQQGNVFRSAPSVPVGANVVSNPANIIVSLPSLLLTNKVPTTINVVFYRWSTAQPVYYQSSSITVPIVNGISTNTAVSFNDFNTDADILGNNILYTTGGVIENVAPPATQIMTLFDNRLWLVDSEDRNLLWFSKQVIESTPVEMSDLLTLYVAPTTGSQGSTGVITALSPMDDKFIIFKKSALGYINGTGPDNTGANNQYSNFTLINSVVGCTNPQSIVFTPQGLMFQSEKGIWILGRDLSTQYIGAPVEIYTQNALVTSALNIPETNQVRFTLDSGVTLMYDYYFGQWGTFNISASSSTIYQGKHAYINSLGQVFQEIPGSYLDGSTPVVMSFTTAWLNFNQLQAYQRAYYFYLLGTYYSPHQLQIQIAYDYQSFPSQISLISPSNFSPAYGTDLTYGSGSPYGGPSTLEQERIFFNRGRCQSLQITMNEIFDPRFGTLAGAGLTLSGLTCILGFKKGYPTMRANQSVG